MQVHALLGGLTLLASGAVAVFFGVSRLRTWFHMRAAPTTPAGFVAPGPVEVVGRAEAAKRPAPRGPFSGEEAAWGSWEVLEPRRDRDDTGDPWEVIASGVLAWRFHVVDGTGRVLVDAKDAVVDLPDSWELPGGIGRDPPPHVVEFLRSRGIEHEGWLGLGRPLRLRERILREGATVYVLGTADLDAAGRTVVSPGREGFPFLVSDRPEAVATARQRDRSLALTLLGSSLLVVGAWVLLAF